MNENENDEYNPDICDYCYLNVDDCDINTCERLIDLYEEMKQKDERRNEK